MKGLSVHTIVVENVNDALHEGIWWLKLSGSQSSSRNGPVVVAPGPVLTVYKDPQQRVLFSPVRDANPFFHFFESLWMLAGRQDVAYPAQFTPRIKQYSDDGVNLNGAYGYRWRERWFDQIEVIIAHLKANPESRREVLTMWTAGDLVSEHSRDLPCNTHVYVDIREGELNITVCNRSNDVWYGAYGANVVHMSFLQEFLARAIGVNVGTYIQFSNNFHLYTELYDGWKTLRSPEIFKYEDQYPLTYPIMTTDWRSWLKDVEIFIDKGSAAIYKDPFFNEVASPMLATWKEYKNGSITRAIDYATGIEAEDWSIACKQWLERRQENRDAKQD